MMNAEQTLLRKLVDEHPALLKQILAFNFLPADYLHASQRPRFCGGADIAPAFWESGYSRRALSSLILQQFNLQEKPCLDMQRWEWALALLGRSALERLARHIGAAILGTKIRLTVSRDEVLRWTDILGADVYRFVMTSAGLLRIPNVPPVSPISPTDEGVAVEAIGYAWILRSLSEAPMELLDRCKLILPFDTVAVEAPYDAARDFVLAVLSALETTWCSSFAIAKN
jgi:hypothetical protein